MPDYPALQIRTPNALETMGNFVNMARGMTALQRERETLQADIEQRKAESEKAVKTVKPTVERAEAEAQTAKTGAQHAAFRLQGEQASRAMGIASGFLQDPRIQKNDAEGIINAGEEAYSQMVEAGVPKTQARFWTSQMQATAHSPGMTAQFLRNVTRSAAGPGAQAGVINAPLGTISTRQGTFPVQMQPGAENAVQPVQPPAGGGGGFPAGVSPGNVERPTADALGRPAIERRDQQGNISYNPPPGSSYRPMMTLPVGETPETAKPLLNMRETAQVAANAAPSQHFNNRKILELSDSALTGTLSPELAKVLNIVGIQNVTGDGAKDTAQLQHFIALQVEKNAAAQGANTDAARSLAAQAVLPSKSPAEAIRAITRVNDGYVTGSELFNRAAQATLANPSNTKDIFALRDLQNAWSANMDPRIFMLENAQKAGDKKEVERIVKGLSPDERTLLATKAKRLQMLIDKGAVLGP